MDQSNEIRELKELQGDMVPKKEKEELEHIIKSSEVCFNYIKNTLKKKKTT